MIWPYVLAAAILGWGMCWSVSKKNTEATNVEEIVKKTLKVEELPSSNSLHKIEFEGHTYIYLINKWNYAGNSFLHDPGCVCQNKK